MEVEQTQSFNQKLSQWIASQGFWFQLRHSMSGGGGWAMTMSHLLRLGFKVLIALVVAAGGFGIYLVKRVDSGPFLASVDASLKSGLGASEAKVVQITRTQGEAQIPRVGVEGGRDSFFKTLDAGNVSFKMGMLDGITNSWEAGTLIAKWMEIEVKAGADSPAEAAALGSSLFKDWEGFSFSTVEVDKAAVRWGYSERTRGKIEGSHLVATRSQDNWRFVFTGGTFSQNWLKNMEIGELIIECSPGLLKITKGEFRCGSGEVKLVGVEVQGGPKPEISGNAELTKVELSALLPEAVDSFLEGVISGEFAISGSTNSTEGVQFEGGVTLGGGNLVSLRERFHLLKSLSVVDVYNSYRKVDLNRGSFHLKTGSGTLELSRVDVKADELMTLQGRVKASFPPGSVPSAPPGSGIFNPVATGSAAVEADGKGGTKNSATAQKTAAAGKGKGGEGVDAKDMAIFGRRAQERITRQLEEEQLARAAQTLRYDGGFRISIPGDAFDTAEVLRQTFAVDPGNGRIAMDVPVQGTIYELTGRQAEELLDLGSKKH